VKNIDLARNAVYACQPVNNVDSTETGCVTYLSRVTDPTQPKPDKATDAEKAEKAEKAQRKLEAERGLLDPADRYKALMNAVKASQDLIELADKKARFALVIMSVLNAVAVVMVVRGGNAVIPSTGFFGMLVRLEFAAYAVTTVYYISQAISALRPRNVRPPAALDLPTTVEPAVSMRVLFYADVLGRERGVYRDLWERLRTDNLTTELADQLYTLSWINGQKYAALDRLYFGLTVMTVMLAVVIGTIGLSRMWS
jgi:hypothetical protein